MADLDINIMKKYILVTGGARYIGSHTLVQLL
jgi:nucleoside-diphosphate-sugar epimerase